MPVVCIDPGHGGSDPGAVGPRGVLEKWVNLCIAARALWWLNKCNVDVVLTRNNDYDVSLQERCDIANASGAECFISIHCNASTNINAQGLEVYYYEGSEKGFRLANLLCANITAVTNTAPTLTTVKSAQIPLTEAQAAELNNRGVKKGHFYVLRYTAMPAALVEVAFLSNPAEEAWLASSTNQELVGKAIAKAVCQYLDIPWNEQVTAEQVIDWLVSKGAVTAPDFWKGALKYYRNLDALLVKLYHAINRLERL